MTFHKTAKYLTIALRSGDQLESHQFTIYAIYTYQSTTDLYHRPEMNTFLKRIMATFTMDLFFLIAIILVLSLKRMFAVKKISRLPQRQIRLKQKVSRFTPLWIEILDLKFPWGVNLTWQLVEEYKLPN